MKRIAISIIASLMLLSGCQVTEDLSISGNGGQSTTDIHVEQFFIDVLNDFAEFLPEDDSSIMESAIDSYASALDRAEATGGVSWEDLGDNRYTVSFDFTSLDDLLEEMGAEGQSLFALTDSSMSFYLDIDSYAELKELVPFLADPNFEVYGPEYNQGMSEADYLDMIYFLLGEDGPDAVSNGTVEIRISVPGTITETSGCEAVSDSAAIFRFPLISFLLLNDPLSFSISWE